MGDLSILARSHPGVASIDSRLSTLAVWLSESVGQIAEHNKFRQLNGCMFFKFVVPSWKWTIKHLNGRKQAMQDAIIREIMVIASKERVYRAITDSAEIIKWFPDAVEGGTLEVGQEPIFSLEGSTHKRRVYTEAANPYDYFSYRWEPGASGEGARDVLSIPNTLVEFSIEEAAGATKVTLKESGFSSLPQSEAESSFKDNNGDWDYMVERLLALLN